MSNSQYLGTNAGFYYYPLSASTWRTYPLAVPLREPRIAFVATQYVADSLDYSRRQVFSVSSTASGGTQVGNQELVGTIRYDDNPVGLIEFLQPASINSGSTDYPIRYTTGLTTGTTSGGVGAGMDVWLIEPMLPMTMGLDRQRASFGDQEVTIRVRSISQAVSFSTAGGARWF